MPQELKSDEVKELCETLLRSSQDSIFAIDTLGNIKYLNDLALKQLGKTAGEVVGKPMADFFPKEIAERQLSNINKVIETAEPMYFESPTMLDNQNIWLSTWLTPIKGPDGSVKQVLGVSRDITHHKQQDEEVEKLNNMMIARETKMIELKEHIAKLEEQLEKKS